MLQKVNKKYLILEGNIMLSLRIVSEIFKRKSTGYLDVIEMIIFHYILCKTRKKQGKNNN